ncbi:MaoC family dehydratase N-terminal domain-containing protein [Brevibacillus sp. FSL L8-0520]|uniref:FAS1-like dehydratase domain-containing protein n=1 Tax=Brevibacillus sp. FSL L8-0520 TaxID=2954689 RepID=UPI0030CD87B4
MDVKAGDVFRWERTFREEEVLQFAELTGDKGRHHVERDEKGRLMIHGFLTASIGTKLGGDMNYIARELVSEFLRPVFSGDTVSCEMTVTEVTQQEGYKQVSVKLIYRNQDGKEVLTGASRGIIRD